MIGGHGGKHNNNIILPGPLTPAQEQEIECRRVERNKIYDDFLKEFADEKGVQESNLTQKKSRGLKKLQKRVKEGSLLVVRMDKSGKFAIMSIEESWRVHTDKDFEVDLDFS